MLPFCHLAIAFGKCLSAGGGPRQIVALIVAPMYILGNPRGEEDVRRELGNALELPFLPNKPSCASLIVLMAGDSIPRGRKPPPIYTENFTRLESVGNKSNRYYWKCKWCGDNEKSRGARVEGRDNKLLNHLTNPRECPGAPSSVRSQAFNIIRTKCPVDPLDVPLPDEAAEEKSVWDPHVTASSDNPSGEGASTTDASAASAALVKRKRAATGALEKFWDRPMTEEQMEHAHVKLLRYVIVF